jgi:hypothetical protein
VARGFGFGLFLSVEKAENGVMPDGYRVEKWRDSGAPDPVDLRKRMESEGFGT